MGPGKCLLSLFMPWHYDWLLIWIYLIFAIYFWVQCFIIGLHEVANVKSVYDMTGDYDYDLIFVATFSMAVCLTITAVYLIFYPISKEFSKVMENLNYQGYIVLVFGCMYTFLGTEDAASGNYGYYMFFNTIVFIAVLVLAQYSIPRWISLVIVCTYVFLMFMLDLGLWATKRDHKVFYVPFVFELLLFSIGIVVLFFRVPERFFKNSTYPEYYLSSHVIFAIFFVSFLFEL